MKKYSFKKFRKNYWNYSLIALLVVLVSTIVFIIFNTNDLIPQSGRIPHDPIYIDGNTAFMNISSSEGWEGNGTYDNPFIIKDYFIENSPNHGIEIRNTDVYFIIYNVSINGGTEIGDFQNGIDLDNVRNGILNRNTVIDKNSGYFLKNSYNITLTENFVSGVNWDGFRLEGCDDIILRRNTVRDCWDGFSLENSDNNTLTENILREVEFENFELKRSNRNNLIANNIEGGDEGFYISLYCSYNIISSNIIKDVRRGMYLFSSDYNTVTVNSITRFSSECIHESFCDGNIISGNECRSMWVDIGIGFLIVLICIVCAVIVYFAEPVAKIKRKIQRKKQRQLIQQKRQQRQIQEEEKQQQQKAKEFETLLTESKQLLDQGNKLYSKIKFEAAIEKWKKSLVKYNLASKSAPLSLEKGNFAENIKILRENICNAYIKSGKTFDIAARKSHENEDIQKADQIWKSAINDFQKAIELIKSEKFDISSSYLEDKINSIKINLKQIDIEKTCVEADRKIETAQSLQNKDLIQATKLTQESFLQYSEAKTRADKYPEFQNLIAIILKKLENAREFQTKLQEKMEELIGIAPMNTKIFMDDVPKRQQAKIDTILEADKIKSGLSILREYEFIGGQIRFKIAIMNKTRSPLTNFKITFDLPDALKWVIHEPNYDRKGDSILISKLGVSEKKTISLYLEPINCLTGPINATISFFDANDRPQAITMEPKMITITCPLFFTKEEANFARVKHIHHSLNHQDRKIFPIKNLEKTALIFNSVLSALGKYDIKLIFKEFSDKEKSGEAWFYGETKIKKNKIITHVSLNGKGRILELEVSGDSEEQITAFLAEIGNLIRQELIKYRIITSEDEFFDMNVSVLSHTCPYCGEGIKEGLVKEFVNGVPIQCNYCNVELFFHLINRK